MTKKQFFDWLATCPTNQLYFLSHEKGIATITVHYDRKRKNKKETKR